MSKQKYKFGQRVRLLTDAFSWYPAGTSGRIEGSYKELYGGGESDKHIYSVHIYQNGKRVNTVSWINENKLEAR